MSSHAGQYQRYYACVQATENKDKMKKKAALKQKLVSFLKRTKNVMVLVVSLTL